MADSIPSIPSMKGRANLLAKVERLRLAQRVAVEKEREREADCERLAADVDRLHAELRGARQHGLASTVLEQRLQSAKAELDAERADLQTLQEQRRDAQADLRKAESELGSYIEKVELEGAADRFEFTVSKANFALTGLAAGALTTAYQIQPEDQALLAWAILVSLGTLGVGLLSYFPGILAASLDALRSRRAKPARQSFMVSWHGCMKITQFVALCLLIIGGTAAWILLAVAFFHK